MAVKFRKLDKAAEQVLEAYNNGMSMDAIAKAHGVSKGTVRNALIAQGVELRKRGRPRLEPVLQVSEGAN